MHLAKEVAARKALFPIILHSSSKSNTKTRKRGKAQRVAHPACANATVHFVLAYKLAMLLSHSMHVYIARKRIIFEFNFCLFSAPTLMME